MNIKNSQAQPDYEMVKREAISRAAASMWYDTNEITQRDGLLDVTVVDMGRMEQLAPGDTHKFFVIINNTAVFVTRTSTGDYNTDFSATNIDTQIREQELRQGVLDTAIEHFMGEKIKLGKRKDMLDLLLRSNQRDEQKHAIVRDELPHLVSGEPRRRWSVQIGNNVCEIGLYDKDDSLLLRVI